MTTLQKLTILGIRNFGTERNDEQYIKFTSPLTLILGENGCGKTTIIECIKYALTGEFPPGANKGQNFVHDPKIYNVSECLGQVKLKVKTVKGDLYTVCRSIKTSVTKRAGASALKFETLDGTMTYQKGGKPESVSLRCVDANVEMANIMGVSKAIINNVLFCHQEESSWPLDQDKKLKERFDAIFGTSDYNKATEKIFKFKKIYDAQVKETDGDLKLLTHMKKEAETKKLKLDDSEGKFNKINDQFEKCNEDMVPIKERLNKICSIELEVAKIYTQKTEKTTEIQKCKDHQASLLKQITTVFEGSLMQLNTEIRTFKDRQSEKTNMLQDLEGNLARIKSQEERLQTQLTTVQNKRSSLMHQRQQEQDFSSERARFVQDLSRQLNIEVMVDLENFSGNIDDLLSRIQDAFRRQDKVLTEMSKSHDQVDQQNQESIDKLREQKVCLENELVSNRKQIAEYKLEQSRNKQNIDNVERSAQALKQVTVEFNRVSKCYDDYTRSLNLESDKKKITDKRAKLKQLEQQQERADEQITFLNSISKSTAEISIKETQMEQRSAEARKVRNKHSDNLKRLLNNQTIEANFKRRIQTIYENMKREIADISKNLAQNERSVTELRMTRKRDKDELTKMEKEITESEEKIYEHCQSTPYEEVVERVKETIAKYQLDYGALNASDALYKKYMQEMETEPCCPLCHNGMSGGDVSELTSELEEKIRRLPENIERIQRILRAEQSKFEKLLALKPVIKRLEQLKIDVPKLKQQLKQTEEKLSATTADTETFQISLAEPNSNLELANSMLGDMSVLDEAAKDIERFERELTELRRKLPERTIGLTMDEAQEQRNTITSELKQERQSLEHMQSKFDEASEMVNALIDKRNKLKDQQIQLQENAQELPQMMKRQTELSELIDKHLLNASNAEVKLAPIKVELIEMMAAKQRSKDGNRDIFNAATKKLNEMKQTNKEVLRFSDELQKLAELNLISEIQGVKIAILKIIDEQKEKATERDQTTDKIAQLNKNIANQVVIERNLTDNKELKILKSEEAELQIQLDALNNDANECDFNSVHREKETLMKKQDQIMGKRSQYIGQMGQLEGQIKEMKHELEQAQYVNAVKNYRQMYYKSVTLRKIVSDLMKYRVALEWALLRYHTEKMDQINRRIKALWHQVYRGNDIDYIQIRTDDIKQTKTDKKRMYDYHVVQIKNDSELEMRGRCSAGQRVLACLIIRIALAETFSFNCGVLALDEPTTNLDRVNIVSLCEALNKIVAERQMQSSFMLLVITHDEEFTSILGRTYDYWRVSRGNTGKSLIRNIKAN